MSCVKNIRAVAFDPCGTLFDVHSVVTERDDLFPGKVPTIRQA